MPVAPPASVFIETTIPSYYVARTPRHPLQVARQRATREWWDGHRHHYALFTSDVVRNEVGHGEPMMAARRLKMLGGLALLESDERTSALAEQLVRKRIIPSHVAEDATHLAVAGVHGVGILLTWNLKHLANPALQPRLKACFSVAGVQLPLICTPHYLLQHEDFGHPPDGTPV